jgi:hypothetical protein
MKRGRRILLVAAGAVAVLTVVFLLWPREREPSYQGKKLSEWLILSEGLDSPQTKAAQEAVRHIGTNAIPVLLDWLDYEPPAWKKKLMPTVLPVGQWDGTAVLELLLGRKGEMHATLAELGFEILGPEARCAVPELTRRMNTRTSMSGDRAVLALANIGKEGLVPLVMALTNAQAINRAGAAAYIGFVMAGPTKTNTLDAVDAVPALVQCIGDKDSIVARCSVMTLGRLRLLPNVVMPALTNALADPRPDIRSEASMALDSFAGRWPLFR